MEYLSQRGIPFTERNISTDTESLRELLNLGSQSTPTTLVDEQVVIGFDRSRRLNQLLGLS
jgi:glutaredoxin